MCFIFFGTIDACVCVCSFALYRTLRERGAGRWFRCVCMCVVWCGVVRASMCGGGARCAVRGQPGSSVPGRAKK